MVDVISNAIDQTAGALEDGTPFVLRFLHDVEADVWKAADVPPAIARHLHLNFPASFRIVGEVPPAPLPPPPPAPLVPGEASRGGTHVVIDAAGNVTVTAKAPGATITDATEAPAQVSTQDAKPAAQGATAPATQDTPKDAPDAPKDAPSAAPKASKQPAAGS